ncbi:hypothetical protein [Curtobacterium sp. MCSS17_016]|uniref:hypothetical protein n=1 Tax=Curtobacterium sp. MCSS17_016 TaxID=2175644 RepID=UPI000DA8735D|nr:hypothetical protein [Curtobacterium sp. MCSS17_016]WIE81184.1 hypothetical protein DEJ19_018295 [Curtobacterium sp. MCSS17_016]
MTLSPDGNADHHLPTRRELRAAERLREQAAHEAEEAAKQQFIAEYEASRQAAGPDDHYNSTSFGFDDDVEPFAHPAANKGSAFYASGSPDGMFDNAAVQPVPLEAEKPAPVVQTTVNYLAIGGIAAAAAATAATFIPTASIVALPLGVLAVVLAFIGLAKRRGSAAIPAVALILAVGAAGWAGWQQFHPSDTTTTATGAAATTLTVTSTGATVSVKDVRFGTTATTPGDVPAPYSTSGTGDVSATAEPATSGDTLTCTISAPGLAPVHQQGQPGQPVHCTSQPTDKDTK